MEYSKEETLVEGRSNLAGRLRRPRRTFQRDRRKEVPALER
jgi:hypothetical protein